MDKIISVDESFWVVIPHSVLSNKNLKDIDKLVYGEISSLTRKDGYCTAHNKHFEDVLNLSRERLRKSLTRLEKEKLIVCEITHEAGRLKGTFRRIKLGGIHETVYGGYTESCIGGTQNCVDKIEIHKRDTKENITSYKKSSLTCLSSNILHGELSTKFGVSIKYVADECEKMEDLLMSKGKTYKDYSAFARNWLRNNLKKEPAVKRPTL